MCAKKMSPGFCKKLSPTNYSFTNHIYLIYMYQQNLALNNQKVLISFKNTTNQIQETNED